MDVVVQHAELLPGPRGEGLWKISVEVVRDGKSEREATIMPADAIEWRMAQFNVDAKTALEMVLLEPYITGVTHHDLELLNSRSEARARKLQAMLDVLAGGAVTAPKGKPKWTVGSGKEPTRLLDSGTDSAIDTILAESPVDEEVIALKREHLDRARERTRARMAPTTDAGPATSPTGEAKKLRRPDLAELRSRLQLDQPVVAEAESSGPADVRRERD